MSWARFDDRYAGNRKIRKAWKAERAAVGLHAMSVTESAQHETDGHVDDDWVEDMLPQKRERDRVVAVLIDMGLWERNGTGYIVNDYLAFNPSREQLEAKRERERARRGGAA